MALETFPYDTSEHLEVGGIADELLQDALGLEDAAYIAHALGVVARARGYDQHRQGGGRHT